MNKLRIVLTAATLGAVMAFTGCSSTHRTPTASETVYLGSLLDHEPTRVGYRRVATPAPPPTYRAPEARPPAVTPPPPAPAPRAGESSDGLVRISKRAPAEVGLGEEFTAEIYVSVSSPAADVIVTDKIPAGASYVSSEPAGQVTGDTVTWKFNEMDPGQPTVLKVRLKADREGNLVNCATAHAIPRVCVTTLVGKAVLAIRKTGPERARIGRDVNFSVEVRNTGTAVARNVVLTDTLPAGLTSATGQNPLTFNLGDLAPGQAKTTAVVAKATERGRHCNNAVAVASNAERVSAEACVIVEQPGIDITKTGTPEQYITRNAEYDIEVTNTGDTTLNNVVVTDTVQSPMRIVEAGGGTVSGNTITFNAGTMEPGGKKRFRVVTTSAEGGRYCNTARVNEPGGLTDSAEACTVWTGVPAILLEMVDDPDPIPVNGNTTYTIRITNQSGQADLLNVNVNYTSDEETTITATSAGQIGGGGDSVTFPNVPRIAPRQTVTYTLTVKGVKTGDSRNKVVVTADGLKSNVEETESTTVF